MFQGICQGQVFAPVPNNPQRRNKMIKKLSEVLAVSMVTLSLAAVSIAADAKPVVETKKAAEGKKPSVKKEKTTHLTATVEAVDLDKRIITVKGPQGNIVDIKAGDEVKNLAQVKVGDIVDLTYYESIAVKVFKPGKVQQGTAEAVTAERLAKPGEKPSGIIGSQVTITATVESISPNKTSVTLKMADGKYKVVKIQNKKNLANVKVGDEVVITATETLAVAVKPAKKQ
jgi:ribosomal 50S subunit-recycling heat shock protein